MEKDNIEYFTILFGTDNRFENKDINDLILGKYVDNKYFVYRLKVNSMVNISLYHNLLLENDFSNSDFKEMNIADIKSEILSRKSSVRKWLFNGVCGDLEQYIKTTLGK